MLSIGALSKSTGIPSETLRTWERRYGFPKPQRSPAGHRVYRTETVEHLHWVNRALEAGNRPSHVLRLSLDQVKNLVTDVTIPTPFSPSALPPNTDTLDADSDPAEVVQHLLEAVAQLDDNRFAGTLRRVWNRRGTLVFLTHYAAPFLDALGESWRAGNLQVAHEHFASEHLTTFLSGIWRPLAQPAVGAPLVLSTLPGEHHMLGLHMVACIVTLAGWRLIFLGRDTPLADIASVATQSHSPWVVLSTSIASRDNVHEPITHLRERLDNSVGLLIGGAGVPDNLPTGVRKLSSLQELSSWAFEQRSPSL